MVMFYVMTFGILQSTNTLVIARIAKEIMMMMMIKRFKDPPNSSKISVLPYSVGMASLFYFLAVPFDFVGFQFPNMEVSFSRSTCRGCSFILPTGQSSDGAFGIASTVSEFE